MNTKTRLATQSLIQFKIDRIEQIRAQLLFVLNQQAAINILQNEVLIEIFREVIALMGKDFVPLISHVCKRWRSVALSVPSLWARFFPPSREGMEAFLKRSGSAPIFVKLREWRTHRIADYWPVLRPAMGRILSLSLETENLTAPVKMRVAIAEILNNLPQGIETLQIGFHSVNVSKESWVTPFHHVHHAARSPFPRLRTFNSHNFFFYWGCGLLKNLHTLVINNDWPLRLSEAELWSLLDAVEACPLLKHLELFPSGAQDPALAPIVTTAPRRLLILMPRLQTIRLSTSLGGAFLTRFALPAVENMEVSALIPHGDWDGTLATLASISDLLHRDDYPMTEIGLTISDDTHAFFAIDAKIRFPNARPAGAPTAGNSTSQQSNLDTLATTAGAVRLNVAYGHGIHFSLPSISKIMEGVILPDPHGPDKPLMLTKAAYRIVTTIAMDDEFWKSIFDMTPAVRSLSLDGCTYEALQGALSALAYVPPPSAPQAETAENEEDRRRRRWRPSPLSNKHAPVLPYLEDLTLRNVLSPAAYLPPRWSLAGGGGSSSAGGVDAAASTPATTGHWQAGGWQPRQQMQDSELVCQIRQCVDSRGKWTWADAAPGGGSAAAVESAEVTGGGLRRVQMPVRFSDCDPFRPMGVHRGNGWWQSTK